ncbi:MAG TPA: cell division protein FtsB [Gammaproteobacteria bacterium]|nr:cell division protein FtsB [Gammaproteobacteria bacterium]
MKARLVIGAILAALLLLMQYRLWIVEDSLPDAWALQKKVSAQKAENEQLDRRNDDLSAEVRDLKQGHDAIEARARKELGMVKSGETFYQIIRPRPIVQEQPGAQPDTDNQPEKTDASH